MNYHSVFRTLEGSIRMVICGILAQLAIFQSHITNIVTFCLKETPEMINLSILNIHVLSDVFGNVYLIQFSCGSWFEQFWFAELICESPSFILFDDILEPAVYVSVCVCVVACHFKCRAAAQRRLVSFLYIFAPLIDSNTLSTPSLTRILAKRYQVDIEHSQREDEERRRR